MEVPLVQLCNSWVKDGVFVAFLYDTQDDHVRRWRECTVWNICGDRTNAHYRLPIFLGSNLGHLSSILIDPSWYLDCNSWSNSYVFRHEYHPILDVYCNRLILRGLVRTNDQRIHIQLHQRGQRRNFLDSHFSSSILHDGPHRYSRGLLAGKLLSGCRRCNSQAITPYNMVDHNSFQCGLHFDSLYRQRLLQLQGYLDSFGRRR